MLILAWRNVWRNRRRSLITLASVSCGLAAVLFGQSLIKSIQIQLIEKSTGILTGHIRVMSRKVKDLKIPDQNIENPAPIEKALSRHPGIEVFSKRILFTGLVSSPVTSKGVLVCGVEAERESRIISIPKYMIEGSFLGPEPRGLVLGDKLARELDIRLGEKLVVMGQALDGSMGAEALKVVGIYHTGSQSFDGQILYIPLKASQELLAMGGRVNDFVVRVRSLSEVSEVQSSLSSALKDHPEVQVFTWKEVDRELLAMQKFQNGLLAVVMGVVFAVVALGILNTMIMSLYERVREFGVLMAIGMKPNQILKMVLLESLFLGLLGLVLGLGIGSFFIAYYGRNGLELPIGEAISYFLPFETEVFLRFAWDNHWKAFVAILCTCLLASLPPALRASRLKVAEALRRV